MVEIRFQTNLDKYKKFGLFPSELQGAPQRGDRVRIKRQFVDHYRSQRLPISLEVVNVEWTENEVICELWYNEYDVKNGLKSDLF